MFSSLFFSCVCRVRLNHFLGWNFFMIFLLLVSFILDGRNVRQKRIKMRRDSTAMKSVLAFNDFFIIIFFSCGDVWLSFKSTHFLIKKIRKIKSHQRIEFRWELLAIEILFPTHRMTRFVFARWGFDTHIYRQYHFLYQ